MKKQLLDDVIFHEERLETFSKPEIIQKTHSPPSVSLDAPVTAYNRPEPDEIEVLATLSFRVIFQVKNTKPPISTFLLLQNDHWRHRLGDAGDVPDVHG
jgi:hypothetical protein